MNDVILKVAKQIVIDDWVYGDETDVIDYVCHVIITSALSELVSNELPDVDIKVIESVLIDNGDELLRIIEYS